VGFPGQGMVIGPKRSGTATRPASRSRARGLTVCPCQRHVVHPGGAPPQATTGLLVQRRNLPQQLDARRRAPGGRGMYASGGVT
jgi:hypothetical protein